MPTPSPHTCTAALKLLADFWHLRVIEALAHNKVQRFCELQRSLDDLNPATLTKKLGVLENAGLLTRTTEAHSHHVTYTLTPRGRKTLPVLRAIKTFSRHSTPH